MVEKYIDKLLEDTIMTSNKIFLETDFWKEDGQIITNELNRLKDYLLNKDEDICGDFNLLLEQVAVNIYESIAETVDALSDKDEKLYYMHELDYIQRRIIRIKIDSFYNDGIDKCKLSSDEAWRKCYDFIVHRFDGTFKYISI